LAAFVIYHVVGVKVGCSKDFARRCAENRSQYGVGIEIEVLDEFEGDDDEATRREAEHARRLGYDPGTPYSSAMHARREAGRRGGIVASGRDSHNSRDPEHMAKFIAAGAAGVATSCRRIECPNCGKVGQARAMARWHFANCRVNSGR
jgi:hypothetical protein